MQNHSLYECKRYSAIALDPVHVGTGGYRLGRVDMSIVREPGTNLPKIPGTSLAGACRAYAAMQVEGKFPRCAGQGQEAATVGDEQKGISKGHCGKSDCPICVTFGFAGLKQSFQGLAQIFDAQIVLFPVHSLAGPVWVTCPDVLGDSDVRKNEPSDEEVLVASSVKRSGRLNLGWLMLAAKNEFSLDGELGKIPEEIKGRAVLVSNKVFSHIVSDNLEVRTSVSIDPATGAASEGALFTYEALPRATVLAFDVVFNDPKFYRIDGKTPFDGENGRAKVLSTVEAGFALFEVLGVGGMNARGMGRLKVDNLQAANTQVTSTEGDKK
jgi:CRISPR-associated protein Cmr4